MNKYKYRKWIYCNKKNKICAYKYVSILIEISYKKIN